MIDESRVQYRLLVEEDVVPVRGNISASGDDAVDAQAEGEALNRLERGDVWAWACVIVEATYPGVPGIVGRDVLGGCNYRDEDDFKASGYWLDMQEQAKADLIGQLLKVQRVLCPC